MNIFDDKVEAEVKQEMFRKWKDFDNLHVQTKKMLIENTINIFSQSRSKENSKDSINISGQV